MADHQKDKSGPRTGRSHADYARGLPGYHDPTAGIGGAAPAQSALTLRAWLAAFGVVVSIAAVLLFVLVEAPIGYPVAVGVAGLVALVDLAWVLHRKRRGEPG